MSNSNEWVCTSDTHAYHDNIIRYSNRPFANVDEMNATLAKNINDSLPGGGTLYHLGDWAFRGLQYGLRFREMIKPGIDVVLILGNHDIHHMKHDVFRKMFVKIYDLLDTHINGQRVTMCHYAMRVWHNSHHGSWHLYGHSHGTLPDDPYSRSFDIGVDCHNYKPLNFDEIKAIMDRKVWKPVDHHTGDTK